jgi:tetratricopeptide (TPR) repeat protein
VVVIGLGLLTWRRNQDYRSEIIIWADGLAKFPDDPVAHYNLGTALERAGRIQEAIGRYEQALQIAPNYPEAQNNLGGALVRLGKAREAVEHLEQALRLRPGYAMAHYNLGIALAQLGRVPEAIGHLEQAVQISPDFAEAHNNLGNALAQVGREREAMGQYEQALAIKPDYAEARNNLAWLLATLAPAEGGDAVRAVTLAERACEMTRNQAAAYLDTLAAAYAAAGRFAEAMATGRKAVELAQSAGQSQLAKEINARLELYRSGHAYRRSSGTSRP